VAQLCAALRANRRDRTPVFSLPIFGSSAWRESLPEQPWERFAATGSSTNSSAPIELPRQSATFVQDATPLRPLVSQSQTVI
jgi:hypothetical protein